MSGTSSAGSGGSWPEQPRRPGYVDAELHPPSPLHPGDWVVVYRFADTATLDAWLRSPTRNAMMATGDDLIEGDAREQVLAVAPASNRVTAVSSVRVRPDEMAAFRALHGEILLALSSMPGFLQADLYEPVPGVQEDTIVVLAFDTREHLDAWLRSDERRRILAAMEQHTVGERTVNVVGGFAGWFGIAGGPDVKQVEVRRRRPPGDRPGQPGVHRAPAVAVPRPPPRPGHGRRQRRRHRPADLAADAPHHPLARPLAPPLIRVSRRRGQ